MNQTVSGRIIKSHGRRFIVEIDGQHYDSTTRGKRTDYACGDHVFAQIQNKEQAVIEKAHERQSLLYRCDGNKSKLIAANVTQIVIVLAAVPTFSEEFLNRCLIAAEASNIKPLIVLNKTDLPEAAAARIQLAPYRKLGYSLLELSALGDVSALRNALQHEVSVLIGQSGMGKSTLTNALIPEAAARTGEISTALDTGKHTTTHAALYLLDDQGSALIDSPGLQAFGLFHLSSRELAECFPEMRPYLGQCRFHNCAHLVEPGCRVIAATQEGVILPKRLELLQRLTRDLSASHDR